MRVVRYGNFFGVLALECFTCTYAWFFSQGVSDERGVMRNGSALKVLAIFARSCSTVLYGKACFCFVMAPHKL